MIRPQKFKKTSGSYYKELPDMLTISSCKVVPIEEFKFIDAEQQNEKLKAMVKKAKSSFSLSDIGQILGLR